MAAVDKTASVEGQVSGSRSEEVSLDPLFKAIVVQNDRFVKDFLEKHSTTTSALVNEFNKSNKSLNDLYKEGRLEFFQTQDIIHFILNGELEHAIASHTVTVSVQAPLHLACIIGHKPTIQVLLDQEGISLEQSNGNDETSLSIACRCAHLHIASLLLDEDLRISHLEDNFGNAPWDYLLYRGIWPEWSQDPSDKQLRSVIKDIVTRLLKEHGGSHPKLPEELRVRLFDEASAAILERFLDVFPDSETLDTFLVPSDVNRSTALHLAVASGRKEIIFTLLKKLDEWEASRKTQVKLKGSATTTNDLCLLKDLTLLLDLQDEDGWTALHFAAAAADLKTVRLLLARHADPSLKTWTPVQSDAGDLAIHFMDQSDGENRKNALSIHRRLESVIFDQATEREKSRISELKKREQGEKKIQSCEKCQCWTWQPGALKVSFQSVPRLIEKYDVKPKTKPSSKDAILWCHLPNNHVSKSQNRSESK